MELPQHIVPFDCLQSAGGGANSFGVDDGDVAGGLVLQSGVIENQRGERESDQKK